MNPGDELIAVNAVSEPHLFAAALASRARPMTLRFRPWTAAVALQQQVEIDRETTPHASARKRRSSRKLSVGGIRQVGSWTDLALVGRSVSTSSDGSTRSAKLRRGAGAGAGTQAEQVPALTAPSTMRIAVTKRHRLRGLLKRVFVFVPGWHVATEKLGRGGALQGGKRTNTWPLQDVASITPTAAGFDLAVYKGFAVQPPLVFTCGAAERKSAMEYWRWQRSEAAQQSAAAVPTDAAKKNGASANVWALVDMLDASRSRGAAEAKKDERDCLAGVCVTREWHLLLRRAPASAAPGAWREASLCVARFALALGAAVGGAAHSSDLIRAPLTQHLAAALAKSKAAAARADAESEGESIASHFALLSALVEKLECVHAAELAAAM